MAKKAASARKATPARRSMSDEHKAALPRGANRAAPSVGTLRRSSSIGPRRAPKRTKEPVERRLAAVEKRLEAAGPLDRLRLVQERIDLQAELAGMNGGGVDMNEPEEALVAGAADDGARRGITYAAWRAAGVSPSVLHRAGIGRAR